MPIPALEEGRGKEEETREVQEAEQAFVSFHVPEERPVGVRGRDEREGGDEEKRPERDGERAFERRPAYSRLPAPDRRLPATPKPRTRQKGPGRPPSKPGRRPSWGRYRARALRRRGL